MKKWELAKKVGQVALIAILLVLPYVLILVIIGTGLASAAYHLGEALGGHGPPPDWLNPTRIVNAIGSAIGALSGGLIAVFTVEYQRLRQKADIRRAVRELLEEAGQKIDEFRRLKTSGDEEAAFSREEIGGALIGAMTIAKEGSGSDPALARLFASMRPRGRLFEILTGDAGGMKLLHDEYATIVRVRQHLPHWRALLD